MASQCLHTCSHGCDTRFSLCLCLVSTDLPFNWLPSDLNGLRLSTLCSVRGHRRFRTPPPRLRRRKRRLPAPRRPLARRQRTLRRRKNEQRRCAATWSPYRSRTTRCAGPSDELASATGPTPVGVPDRHHRIRDGFTESHLTASRRRIGSRAACPTCVHSIDDTQRLSTNCNEMLTVPWATYPLSLSQAAVQRPADAGGDGLHAACRSHLSRCTR